MVQICSDFENMMAFWRRWFIKREFWNRSMWNIMCSMCWFEFQDRTGWCFSPTGRGKGTNSHPHWPWDVTQYQNGRHEWNRKNTWKSQTSPVLRRQMDLHLENKGLLKIFPGKGNFSKNHQVLGGCSCSLLYPSGGYGPWLIYADWIIAYTAALLCQTFHAKSLQ